MSNLFETNYYDWLNHQLDCLKTKQFDKLDLTNLVDEIEDMGGSKLDSIESYLVVILTHLLKYQYQTYILNPKLPEPKEFKSWYDSIDSARDNIEYLLKKKPSLNSRVKQLLPDAYSRAVKAAVRGMNRYLVTGQKPLSENNFSKECPWDLKDVLKENWLP